MSLALKIDSVPLTTGAGFSLQGLFVSLALKVHNVPLTSGRWL